MQRCNRHRGQLPAPQPQGFVWEVDQLLRVSEDGRVVSDFGSHRAVNQVIRVDPVVGGLTGGEPPYQYHLLVGVVDSVVCLTPLGPSQFDLYSSRGTLSRSVRVARPRSGSCSVGTESLWLGFAFRLRSR